MSYEILMGVFMITVILQLATIALFSYIAARCVMLMTRQLGNINRTLDRAWRNGEHDKEARF